MKKMVEQGCVENGKKLSAVQMQEQLKLFYPNLYIIPSIHKIKSYITTSFEAIREVLHRCRNISAMATKTGYIRPISYSSRMYREYCALNPEDEACRDCDYYSIEAQHPA